MAIISNPNLVTLIKQWLYMVVSRIMLHYTWFRTPDTAYIWDTTNFDVINVICTLDSTPRRYILKP